MLWRTSAEAYQLGVFEFGAKSVTEQEELSGHMEAGSGSETQIAKSLESEGRESFSLPHFFAGSSGKPKEHPVNGVAIGLAYERPWFPTRCSILRIIGSVSALDGAWNRGERFVPFTCGASGVTKSYAFEEISMSCTRFASELIIDDAAAELSRMISMQAEKLKWIDRDLEDGH